MLDYNILLLVDSHAHVFIQNYSFRLQQLVDIRLIPYYRQVISLIDR